MERADDDARGLVEAAERRLRAHGLSPRSPDRPIVPADARPREPVAVAARAVAAWLTATRAEGADAESVSALATRFGLVDAITPSEALVLFSPQPLTPDVAQRFQWRFEAAWALLWALGHVEELSFPERTCDAQRASALITEAASVAALAEGARPRAPRQVLEEAELTLRLQAICEHEIESTGRAPERVLYPVVHQRRAAFRWMLLSDAPDWADEPFDP
jgi:hypothetical protein